MRFFKRAKSTPQSTAGSFARHDRSAPDTHLAGPILDLSDETVDVVFTQAGALTAEEAKQKLGMAGEHDETLWATLDLLGTWRRELVNLYEDPADGAELDTELWYQPNLQHVVAEWHRAGVHRNPDGKGYVVSATAALDFDGMGFKADQSEALESLVFDHMAQSEHREWDIDGRHVDVEGTRVFVTVELDVVPQEFSPELVSTQLNSRLSKVDPSVAANLATMYGYVATNAELAEANSHVGAAVEFAAKNGRVPTTSETIAAARALADTIQASRLARGYVMSLEAAHVSESAAALLWAGSKKQAQRKDSK